MEGWKHTDVLTDVECGHCKRKIRDVNMNVGTRWVHWCSKTGTIETRRVVTACLCGKTQRRAT